MNTNFNLYFSRETLGAVVVAFALEKYLASQILALEESITNQHLSIMMLYRSLYNVYPILLSPFTV